MSGEIAINDALAGAPVRIIVLGRPGSGKGTQSALLSDALRVPHVSTGDLLRHEIATGTRLGRRIADIVADGALVPDAVVLSVLERRLSEPDVVGHGFVLDGYPRSVPQALALEEAIAPGRITCAVELLVSEREAAERLSARFVCVDCGVSPYRIVPLDTGEVVDVADPFRCAACGGVLRRRADDGSEVVERRFEEFRRTTKPLLEWLDRRGLLVTIDAEQPPADVAATLVDRLGPFLDGPSCPRPPVSA